MKRTHLLFTSMILLLMVTVSIAQAAYPKEIADRITRIKDALGAQVDPGSIRGGIANFELLATIPVMSSEFIRAEAKRLGIVASEEEIDDSVLTMLARKRIVDPLTRTDWKLDPNITKWLEFQRLSADELKEYGTDLVLWSKIALQNVGEVPEHKLEEFLKANPGSLFLPDRVVFEIETYNLPGLGSARSLSTDVLCGVGLESLRSAASIQRPRGSTKLFEGLTYYFTLDNLDPELARVIGGKRAADSFGPVILSNGAVVSGRIKQYLPAVSLVPSKDLLSKALLSYATEHVGKEVFLEAGDRYVNSRGIFGSIWKTVKKGFRYATAATGGVAGFLLGGPTGAMAGAKLGWGVGNKLQSWWRNPHQVPQTALFKGNYSIPDMLRQYYQTPMPINNPWSVNWQNYMPANGYGNAGYGPLPHYTNRVQSPYPSQVNQDPFYPPLYSGYF